jgi:hypothetical protein
VVASVVAKNSSIKQLSREASRTKNRSITVFTRVRTEADTVDGCKLPLGLTVHGGQRRHGGGVVDGAHGDQLQSRADEAAELIPRRGLRNSGGKVNATTKLWVQARSEDDAAYLPGGVHSVCV